MLWNKGLFSCETTVQSRPHQTSSFLLPSLCCVNFVDRLFATSFLVFCRMDFATWTSPSFSLRPRATLTSRRAMQAPSSWRWLNTGRWPSASTRHIGPLFSTATAFTMNPTVVSCLLLTNKSHWRRSLIWIPFEPASVSLRKPPSFTSFGMFRFHKVSTKWKCALSPFQTHRGSRTFVPAAGGFEQVSSFLCLFLSFLKITGELPPCPRPQRKNQMGYLNFFETTKMNQPMKM